MPSHLILPPHHVPLRLLDQILSLQKGDPVRHSCETRSLLPRIMVKVLVTSTLAPTPNSLYVYALMSLYFAPSPISFVQIHWYSR